LNAFALTVYQPSRLCLFACVCVPSGGSTAFTERIAVSVMRKEKVMSWSAVASLNSPREGLAVANAAASAPLPGFRIYAVGGDEGGPPVGVVEAYDPAANSWTVLAGSLPTPRTNLAAAAANGVIHAIGGSDGSGPLATHEIYNPVTGAWTSAPPLPTARADLAAVTGPDGRVYAIGGVAGPAGSPSYLGVVEVYDPAAGGWAAGPSMPTPRGRLAACVLGGLIYAIGGENAAGALTSVEVLDPVAMTWGTLPALPAARTGLAASAGPGGLVYAIGGLDDFGAPQQTVYGYDPVAASWSAQPPLLTPQGFLAGGTGPDGRLYAIGGQDFLPEATVEVFDAGSAQPDPYIGNGTYQSPDIILLDSNGNPVPLGGAPSGAWDTLLLPNTDYGIQAMVSNDAATPANDTVVRFWHFPGGVGSAGTLIDVQYVTVPAAGSITVPSARPFHSAGAGQHECVAVSVANAQSPYFNVDPTTATEVVDPTVPRPGGSGHFGSAWRNTNSILVGPGMGWRLGFAAGLRALEPVTVRIDVATVKVPLGWDRTDEALTLRNALQFTGAQPRMPLFLVPAIRSGFHTAHDLDIEIRVPGEDKAVQIPAGKDHHLTVPPGHSAHFTVSGRIPPGAHPGDVYLVDVGAHYPTGSAVRFLEVIYVKE